MARKPKAAVRDLPKTEIIHDFDITTLMEHPDNPRLISRDGEAKLAASIEEFGVVDTITANRRPDGTIVVLGGHQRLKVMLKRGTTKAPVTLVTVTPEQEKRLLLMLNGHHGRWDTDKLTDMLQQMADAGDDIATLGLEGVEAYESKLTEMTEQSQKEADDIIGEGAEEVDVDSITLKHRCPKCGFEFDKDTSESGDRGWSKKDASADLEDDE